MYSIKSLPKFSEWLNSLPDAAVRGTILARIKRLKLGLMVMLSLSAMVYQNYASILARGGESILCREVNR